MTAPDDRPPDEPRPETLAAQAAHRPEGAGDVTPPIHVSTNYARGPDYALMAPGRGYSRDENPTYAGPETLLARLEGGAEALLFSSGMAAAMALVQALRPGARIAAPRIMYWGLRDWLVTFCRDWGLGLDLFDAGDPAALSAALRPGQTQLLWIETPCNPTWELIDIAAAAAAAHAAGARLAVDSTVATPVLTQPLALGADLVFHSATKYLNGHGDVVAGAVVTARRDDFWARVAANRRNGGAVPGAFEAWLLQRGLRTLYLRVARASENALAVARHFSGHAAIAEVRYPGLPSHPGHEIARRQMRGGFGGMLGLRLRGGAPAALEVCRRVRFFVRATSLGGTESLIEHRASIEGPDSPIPADLLRLSLGIEHPDDLIADLEQALDGL